MFVCRTRGSSEEAAAARSSQPPGQPGQPGPRGELQRGRQGRLDIGTLNPIISAFFVLLCSHFVHTAPMYPLHWAVCVTPACVVGFFWGVLALMGLHAVLPEVLLWPNVLSPLLSTSPPLPPLSSVINTHPFTRLYSASISPPINTLLPLPLHPPSPLILPHTPSSPLPPPSRGG